ncbi:hypothetical protein CP532_1491 [Ophiocordyceps camponoti-leonardi (nom. inval.)]|nr:hypothetical protein CP532_1491 [Ophiocordyceps camponoti-leonardi (nom. inval.)]
MACRCSLTAFRLASKLKAPTITCQFRPSSSQTPPDRPVLGLGAVTPALFEQAMTRSSSSFDRYTPQQYYALAEKFLELTEKTGSVLSVRDSSLPPEVMHEIGCILCYLSKYTKLSKAMWLTASHAGYVPSTISLAMHIIKAECFGQLECFRKVEAHFKQLVEEGKNLDALTVEGLRLFRRSDYYDAMQILIRAIKISGGRNFELRNTCELHLAKIALKSGKNEVALSVLGTLSKSGLAEAHAELGRLLRPTDPVKARQHLYEGAPGRTELYRDLSEMALEDAASATGAQHKNLSQWAWEWSRLADPSVRY